jgi:8-oxo-dGTP pyrophosphatase MutT (NUDIX family)
VSGQLLSSGVVVVRDTPGGLRLLMLRAYRNWDFPKGLVEPGEDPLAAAVRETEEETGIADLAFDWGTQFFETDRYARNKIARYYLARTRSATVELKPNPVSRLPEHHEYRWVSVPEAHALAVPRIQAVVAWAASRFAR